MSLSFLQALPCSLPEDQFNAMHTSLKLLGLHLPAAPLPKHCSPSWAGKMSYPEILRVQLCSSQHHLCDTVIQLPCITSRSYVGSSQAEVLLFRCVLFSQFLATSSGLLDDRGSCLSSQPPVFTVDHLIRAASK